MYAQNSILCQFGNSEICPNFANPYLTQFSSISGGNCITDEGESTKVEEEYTTSEELTEEYSTFSDMSKQDSESDINVDETQHQETAYTPETLQNNTTIHDIDDLIHDENNA